MNANELCAIFDGNFQGLEKARVQAQPASNVWKGLRF